MDDKRYNVWTIMNEDGQFYNRKIERNGRYPSGKPRYKFVGIEWIDGITLASYFNYKTAEKIVDELYIEASVEGTQMNGNGLTIMGHEQYKKLKK
jgi:hypothetical protein